MLGNTLLVIDDDCCWRNATARYFSKILDYRAHAVGGSDAIKLAKEVCPDFIILNCHLINTDAEALAKVIRSSDFRKAIMIVVSCDESSQTAAYRDYQADHFAMKPVHYQKLHNVMCALKRRLCWERGVTEKGDIRLESAGFRVVIDSKFFIQLSQKSFSLLLLLIEKSPGFVPEEVIVKRVYKTDFAREKTAAVKMLIYRLKQDLGQYSNRILNQRGSGWAYSPFCAEETK